MSKCTITLFLTPDFNSTWKVAKSNKACTQYTVNP